MEKTKKKKPYVSIFVKLAVIFFAAGLIPLLFLSRFFFSEFVDNMETETIKNGKTTLEYAGSFVDDWLEKWGELTVSMYTRPIAERGYLIDELTDDSIQPSERAVAMRRFLLDMASDSQITSVRFLDWNGNLYYVSNKPGKILDSEAAVVWKQQELSRRRMEKTIRLIPAHTDSYFKTVEDQVITIERNFYDVRSIKNVDQCLGTLYIDVSQESINQIMDSIDIGEKSGFYIMNEAGEEIYHNKRVESLSQEVSSLIAGYSDAEYGTLQNQESFYHYQKHGDSGWISVVSVHKEDVLNRVKMTKQYIMITLSASCLILVLIYVGFSKWITIPIQKLKGGMEQIQKGYLDTRIKIGRNDEIGLLGEGLNEMAAQLETYIEQAYGAELRQREAELNALKTQIKPHYLYNTLDIIRMTALTNEDMQTARMIESLAGQLRYLIGSSSDKVCLEEELQNIKNYFTMIKIRYEERFDLKLSVPERLQKAMILKLSLQPFVENAVAHGLKLKKGQGMVWISARQNEDMLELTVMDDGVGIQPEKLAKLQAQIDCVEGTAELSKASGGVGICNVQERIRKNFGPQYGIEIKSTEQTGTIVILRFPYLLFPEGGVTDVPGSID